MGISGVWLTSNKDLWVLEELSRPERFYRDHFIARFVSYSSGNPPSRSVIHRGVYLTPKVVTGIPPNKLRVVSLKYGSILILKKTMLETDYDSKVISMVLKQAGIPKKLWLEFSRWLSF